MFLDAAELSALDRLAQSGTQVEVRAVPTEAPLLLPQLKARFVEA